MQSPNCSFLSQQKLEGCKSELECLRIQPRITSSNFKYMHALAPIILSQTIPNNLKCSSHCRIQTRHCYQRTNEIHMNENSHFVLDFLFIYLFFGLCNLVIFLFNKFQHARICHLCNISYKALQNVKIIISKNKYQVCIVT